MELSKKNIVFKSSFWFWKWITLINWLISCENVFKLILILIPSAFLFWISSFHWSIFPLSSTLIVKRIFRLEFLVFNRSDLEAEINELFVSISKCVQRCVLILSNVNRIGLWYFSALELIEQNIFCWLELLFWLVIFSSEMNQLK